MTMDSRALEYHKRQFLTPSRSTIHLARFVQSVLPNCDQSYSALDAGCGAGATMCSLSRTLGRTSWTGVDINEELFTLGRQCMAESGQPPAQIRFMAGDFFQLEKLLPVRSFDLVFCLQTISWMPSYEKLMVQLLRMLKPGGVIFLSSLFTDFLVDANIQISEYGTDRSSAGGGRYYYNVYCLDRFRDYCLSQGACDVQAEDFEMDIDLAFPDHRHMGTFTRALADGRRLQCSGPLLMPWKFVAVRMPSP